jgi:hypothetical protein
MQGPPPEDFENLLGLDNRNLLVLERISFGFARLESATL